MERQASKYAMEKRIIQAACLVREEDAEKPEDKTTDETGASEFWASPRGYAVYVPES